MMTAVIERYTQFPNKWIDINFHGRRERLCRTYRHLITVEGQPGATEPRVVHVATDSFDLAKHHEHGLLLIFHRVDWQPARYHMAYQKFDGEVELTAEQFTVFLSKFSHVIDGQPVEPFWMNCTSYLASRGLTVEEINVSAPAPNQQQWGFPALSSN